MTLLYDLSTDIGELTNVADDHPEVVAILEAAIATWDAEMGGPLWPAFRSTLDEIDGQMVHLFFRFGLPEDQLGTISGKLRRRTLWKLAPYPFGR